LQNPDTKRQIESLFDASYLIEKGQYGQGGKLLLGTFKLNNARDPKVAKRTNAIKLQFFHARSEVQHDFNRTVCLKRLPNQYEQTHGKLYNSMRATP
jgi:hypothetical protein